MDVIICIGLFSGSRVLSKPSGHFGSTAQGPAWFWSLISLCLPKAFQHLGAKGGFPDPSVSDQASLHLSRQTWFCDVM